MPAIQRPMTMAMTSRTPRTIRTALIGRNGWVKPTPAKLRERVRRREKFPVTRCGDFSTQRASRRHACAGSSRKALARRGGKLHAVVVHDEVYAGFINHGFDGGGHAVGGASGRAEPVDCSPS